MSDYIRPTDKAVDCALADCEFAASDIDALAVPIGKMTLRHVVEEIRSLRAKLAAAEAELKQEKENGVQAEVTIGLLRVMVEDLKKSLKVTETQYEESLRQAIDAARK